MESKKPLLVILSVFAFVVAGSVAASLLIRGYRPDFKKGGILATGLLATTSKPEGASVYINGKLVTATDDTINLKPDKYKVRIIKDGFLPWEKEIVVKKEVVKQTDAYLFRAAPDLKPLTNTGAIHPVLSPDGYKIVYAVASASAQTKNGVWVTELTGGFTLSRSNQKQLARPTGSINWSQYEFKWSPDSNQVLATLTENDKIKSAFLLDANRTNSPEQLRDVSLQLEFILQDWEQQRQKVWQRQLKKLPLKMQKTATQSAVPIAFSPNEERLLYLATAKDKIAQDLLPHPPARSDQPEEREIKPGVFYVYDLKEDTNFKIASAEQLGIDWENISIVSPTPTPSPNPSPTLQPTLTGTEELPLVPTIKENLPIRWLATSRHLVFIEENKIKVIEADGTNKQTVYAGPLEDKLVFPWPDAKRIIVLTPLYTDLPANLYELTIH
jgi:hypothetical protein